MSSTNYPRKLAICVDEDDLDRRYRAMHERAENAAVDLAARRERHLRNERDRLIIGGGSIIAALAILAVKTLAVM